MNKRNYDIWVPNCSHFLPVFAHSRSVMQSNACGDGSFIRSEYSWFITLCGNCESGCWER